jgi:hypothetical protein
MYSSVQDLERLHPFVTQALPHRQAPACGSRRCYGWSHWCRRRSVHRGGDPQCLCHVHRAVCLHEERMQERTREMLNPVAIAARRHANRRSVLIVRPHVPAARAVRSRVTMVEAISRSSLEHEVVCGRTRDIQMSNYNRLLSHDYFSPCFTPKHPQISSQSAKQQRHPLAALYVRFQHRRSWCLGGRPGRWLHVEKHPTSCVGVWISRDVEEQT